MSPAARLELINQLMFETKYDPDTGETIQVRRLNAQGEVFISDEEVEALLGMTINK